MKIQELTAKIRENYMKNRKEIPMEELCRFWIQEDLLYSGKGKAMSIVFPTRGCSWSLSKYGGCTMCGYVKDTLLKTPNQEKLKKLFDGVISSCPKEENIAIKIFTSGSFFNSKELPESVRYYILHKLSKLENVSEISVESRPEYIKKEILKECCEILQDKIFEVSIGLESSNDEIRIYKINKGFTLKDFENALRKIKSLKKEFNIKTKSYILVKPILMTEEDSIKDSINSAIYAEKVGIDRISFCPATVHAGTLMENLWKWGAYRPPWIWSLVEIINKVRETIEIPAIMDTAGMGSKRGPHNCGRCDSKLKKLIIQSNLDQSPVPEIKCKCKKRWKAEKYGERITASSGIIKYIHLR